MHRDEDERDSRDDGRGKTERDTEMKKDTDDLILGCLLSNNAFSDECEEIREELNKR